MCEATGAMRQNKSASLPSSILKVVATLLSELSYTTWNDLNSSKDLGAIIQAFNVILKNAKFVMRKNLNRELKHSMRQKNRLDFATCSVNGQLDAGVINVCA